MEGQFAPAGTGEERQPEEGAEQAQNRDKGPRPCRVWQFALHHRAFARPPEMRVGAKVQKPFQGQASLVRGRSGDDNEEPSADHGQCQHGDDKGDHGLGLEH